MKFRDSQDANNTKEITTMYEMFVNSGLDQKTNEVEKFKNLPGVKDFIIEKFNTHVTGNEALVIHELYDQLISGELSNLTLDLSS